LKMFKKRLMITELKSCDKNLTGMTIDDRKIILMFYFKIKQTNQII